MTIRHDTDRTAPGRRQPGRAPASISERHNTTAPMQQRGMPRVWRQQDIKGFLRQLRWWAEFGPLYVIQGDGPRVAIIVTRVIQGECKWQYSYTREGIEMLLLLERISLEEVAEIPGFGHELAYVGGNQQCMKLTITG